MNDTLDIEQHLKAFAEAFMLDARKETWTRLLCERPDDIFKRASKFFNYLDHNFIEQDNQLNNIAADDASGVFYDEPKCISLKKAIETDNGRDAIFSIIPGELAIYISPEGWNFVCRR